MNELLKDFTFVVDLNIEWGDMDALRHVNNIEYFKYFEYIGHENAIKSALTVKENLIFYLKIKRWLSCRMRKKIYSGNY